MKLSVCGLFAQRSVISAVFPLLPRRFEGKRGAVRRKVLIPTLPSLCSAGARAVCVVPFPVAVEHGTILSA